MRAPQLGRAQKRAWTRPTRGPRPTRVDEIVRHKGAKQVQERNGSHGRKRTVHATKRLPEKPSAVPPNQAAPEIFEPNNESPKLYSVIRNTLQRERGFVSGALLMSPTRFIFS